MIAMITKLWLCKLTINYTINYYKPLTICKIVIFEFSIKFT